MNTSFFTRLCGLLLAATTVGCGEYASDPRPQETVGADTASQPIQVTCTTNIIKDLVQQIGGEHVVVKAIMDGPGVDPHTYTPSPKDTNALTAADLVVYSGLHLEGQLEEALESLGHRGVPVICVTEGLQQESPGRLIHAAGLPLHR